MLLYQIAIYSALIGLLFLTIAMLIGLRVIKLKSAYKAHKLMALSGFVCVLFHAAIMIYSSL